MTNHEILNNMLQTIENFYTRKTAENAIKQFLKWVDEKHQGILTEKQVVPLWKTALNGISENTWYQYYSWVQKYYTYIENPTEYKIRPIQNRTFLRDALYSEQVTTVLNLAYKKAETGKYRHVRNYCIMQLLFFTGMRIGEIANIDIEDIKESIDTETEKQIYEIRLLLKGRKTKDHIVIITNSAYHTLKHYLEIRKGKSREAVFVEVYKFKYGTGNNRLRTETISRMVKALLGGAGIDNKRITAHSIRHTAATNALEHGATLKQVQYMLGHASMKTTEKYIHMLPKLKGENFIEYNNQKAIEGRER